MRKFFIVVLGGLLVFATSLVATAESKPVGITPEIMAVPVTINGAVVEFKRNQDNDATVNPAFAKTSRPCPPFCIQPSKPCYWCRNHW